MFASIVLISLTGRGWSMYNIVTITVPLYLSMNNKKTMARKK